MRHDPGLAASPPARYILKVEGSVLSLDRPLWTDSHLAKRQRAACGGTAGSGGSPTGLRMQPRNEKFFTPFGKAGFNVVDGAELAVAFSHS